MIAHTTVYLTDTTCLTEVESVVNN